MKKIVFVVFLGFTFFACNYSNEDGRLDKDAMFLPSILSEDGQVLTLTFDSKNRIIQLGEVSDNSETARLYTFNYVEGVLKTAEAVYFSTVVTGGYNYVERFEFEYVQDRVLVEKDFLDSSGYATTTNTVLYVDQSERLLRGDGIQITYDERGNMNKVVDNGNVTEISFDNMKGAFANVKTPKWALYYIMKLGNFYSVNNPVMVKGYPSDLAVEFLIERVFEYNSNGFPVKFNERIIDVDEEIKNKEYYIEYLRLYQD